MLLRSVAAVATTSDMTLAIDQLPNDVDALKRLVIAERRQRLSKSNDCKSVIRQKSKKRFATRWWRPASLLWPAE